MPLVFYPHADDTQKGSLEERIEVLMEGAERYKAAVLDVAAPAAVTEETAKKRMTPREQAVAYNWEEVARVLREIRDLPEATIPNKARKDRKSTRLNSSHSDRSRMPSSA